MRILLVVFLLTISGCAGLEETIGDVVTFAGPAATEVAENFPENPSNPLSWLLVGTGAVAAGTAALRRKKNAGSV